LTKSSKYYDFQNRVSMERILLITIVCGLSLTAQSQNASVEKSTNGIQTGILGIWAHREVRLSNKIALRTEVGMDAGFWFGSFYPKTGYAFTPVIALEHRWYYNLNKRISKSKNIAGNSGNFLSLPITYHPNWFVISNYKGVEIADQVSVIPTWGIRRNKGDHFTFETGIGIGYRYIFAKSAGYLENAGEVVVDLRIRLGYRF
jgi:hypothetical protein